MIKLEGHFQIMNNKF